jgi:hypothetical protein
MTTCRSRTDELLGDSRALDGLALMLFPRGFTQSRSFVARFCSVKPFVEAAKRRLEITGPGEPHETVALALRRAVEELDH